MNCQYLGIRHHGPGSARQLLTQLVDFQPDAILIEGPEDASEMLSFIADSELIPPVALLGYAIAEPGQGVFYPFCEFSPEWQAIRYAFEKKVSVKFMDLPFSLRNNIPEYEKDVEDSPMKRIAEIAGYENPDTWWELNFEQRKASGDYFEVIQLTMEALRESSEISPRDKIREAWMRKNIRNAESEGVERLAVVCGAWHVPALMDMPSKGEDQKLLKGFKKQKVDFTWIPWTHSRMTFRSGYGAGIHSPGWYQHLWEHQLNIGSSWLVKVAHMFRRKKMDISPAHVIETIRMADSLAALRGRTMTGLDELNDAVLTVMAGGEDLMMELVKDELIVSFKIGSVPESIPLIPLQRDLTQKQKKLRMKPSDSSKQLKLDLRKETDLERSKLLHRLNILEVHWGEKEKVTGKGTFKELWTLSWEPELMIKLVEKSIWGNTIEGAATSLLIDKSLNSSDLGDVANLLALCIPADLQKVIPGLVQRIQSLSAISGDIVQLMQILTPLLDVTRYGDVRNTDTSMLYEVITGIIERVCIGLPYACTSLDYESAAQMTKLISQTHSGIRLLMDQNFDREWEKALWQLSIQDTINSLVSGKASRILNDWQKIEGEDLAKLFSQALSTGKEMMDSAYWLEGFLVGGGAILLLDNKLWNILNEWVKELESDTFLNLLPILRRSFSSMSYAERRKIGERAKEQDGQVSYSATLNTSDQSFNFELAKSALPILRQLLG